MCTTDRFQACVILESVSFIFIPVLKQSIIWKRRKIKVSKRTWHWLLSNARLFFVWIFYPKIALLVQNLYTDVQRPSSWDRISKRCFGVNLWLADHSIVSFLVRALCSLAPTWKPSLAVTFARKLLEFSTENDHDKIYDVENDDSQLEFVETFDLFDF